MGPLYKSYESYKDSYTESDESDKESYKESYESYKESYLLSSVSTFVVLQIWCFVVLPMIIALYVDLEFGFL